MTRKTTSKRKVPQRHPPLNSERGQSILPTTITSGFAHNFNNLLTIISGNLQVVALRTNDSSLAEPIREAILACEIGAHMVSNLITFAGQRRLDVQSVDLEATLASISDLVRKVVGQKIAVSFPGAARLPAIRIDRTEFANAIINLCLNARDAMPNGGALDFSFEPHRDRFIILSVKDSGMGMAPTVKARACEPFFTTKGPGIGTGLGLATVLGFVEQVGGWLDIESTPGSGTTVRLAFPILQEHAS